MSNRRSSSAYPQEAASVSGGGCISGLLLPPLAVLCIGAILAFFVLGSSSPLDPVVQAAAAYPVLSSPITGAASAISPIFTPEVQYWSAKIEVWASQAGLDPNLLATVMQMESCGDPKARSRSGAMGLFQVMPYHFANGEDPYDPDTNALRAVDYLKRSLKAANSDPRLALAGYNGGIGVIGRPEYQWAIETQNYAARGIKMYQDASSGNTVQLIGGSSLCRQADARLGITP
jgi:soluble lytic murein transglycosylase-like protein